MRIIAYRTSLRNKKVLIEESGGEYKLTNDIGELFTFMFAPEEGAIQVCWNLDATVSLLLRLMGEKACRDLWKKKRSFFPPFTVFYVPEKTFIVRHTPSSRKWRLYGLEQYFPELGEPADVDEVQMFGVKLMRELEKMGMVPTKLTSPIAIYDECVMSKLDLPKLKYIPAKCAEYAYRTAGRLWIEAHKLGKGDNVFDYDLSSAFPSVAKELIDVRDLNWIESTDYQEAAVYGYAKCEVTICDWVMVSPIIRETEEGLISPIGAWEEFLTKGELDFITKHGIGEWKIIEGYWAFPKRKRLRQPLKEPLEKLLTYKQGTELQKLLAKRMCFSEDTQVMAQSGAKPITELQLGELVYSINPSTLEVSLKPVIAANKYPYNGQLIRFENKRHDFLVTPEHRMLLRRDVGKEYQFLEAEEIQKRTVSRWLFPPFAPIAGIHRRDFSVWGYQDEEAIVHVKPNKRYSSTFEKDKRFRYIGCGNGYHGVARHIKNPHIFEKQKDCCVFMKNARRSHDLPWHFAIDDWLELAGWYISEGCLYDDKESNSRAVHIIQKHYVEEIHFLLVRMDLPFTWSKHKNGQTTFKIPHKAVCNYLAQNCGVKARNKKIPDEIFTLAPNHLWHLFKALMLGDGTIGSKKQTTRYSTISPKLAKDFQRLCLHLGYKTRIAFEDGKSPIYRVCVYNLSRPCSGIERMRNNQIRREPYNGYVWGITVEDNFTVLAGRNNKFEFVGQSVGVYGRFGEDWGEEFGNNFNSVWFSEVATQIRLQLGESLYAHGIGPWDNEGYHSLIQIGVDGFMTDNPVQVEDEQWKLAYQGPALVIGSGLVYTQLTKPKGLRLNDVLGMIKEHPLRGIYKKQIERRLTLGDALAHERLGEIGNRMLFSTGINLMTQEHDRQFKKIPKTGQQLLGNHYDSEPIKV